MKHLDLKLQHLPLALSISFLVLFQLNCTAPTPAEQGRQVLEEAAEAMGGLEALDGIDNITREGNSQRSSLGQGHVTTDRLLVGRPSPFKQIIDFTVPREVDLSGSREVPTVADWEKGGYRNVFGMALRPLEPQQLRGTKTEWDRDIAKFLVHALGDGSTIDGISEGTVEGKPHQVVTLKFIDGTDYKVYVDDTTHLITKLEFTEDRNPYGDVAKERIFEQYLEVGNLTLPFTETTKEMGELTQMREWSNIAVNGELSEEQFQIPEELQERAQEIGHADTILVVPSKLADGVYFGESMHMNNMWVEFEDFIVVVEGPGNEMHSLEVIRHIRETVGDKPIRYLITTHHHSDHTGGIRTYVGEGATVVTHANNEEVIREILTRPHTLKPDHLALSGQEPQIEVVEDTHTITDGKRTIELMHVPNPHANGYLAIYLPKERLFFESDMFQIQGDHWQVVLDDTPRVPEEGKILYQAVTKAGWRPSQIVPGHGIILPWKLLADTVKASE
ncbi:MBL fold metallo-hydrolase [Acidobacteria bacterium AH-259-D05]|nr:MBL fold metallo-hydrolase [Acidobacteria bacterium AH-259-D05]